MNYELINRYMVHYVTDKGYKGYANIHTHGLEENFGHKDLQLVLPYSPQEASVILNIMVDMIDKGGRFASGHKYSGIFPTCDIEVIEKQESERTVMRILIPDADCISPFNAACSKLYKGQLTFDPDRR